MLAPSVDPGYGAGETESSKALEEDLKDRAVSVTVKLQRLAETRHESLETGPC